VFGVYGGSYPLRLRAGVVGGTVRTAALSAAAPPDPATRATITGAGLYTAAYDEEEVVLSLPEAGPEVLLELRGACDRFRSAPYETGAWVERIVFD
jgi:hypothetical protein